MVNRSFLYGDGLFETIRVSEGRALYLPAHFERLSKGLNILQMQEVNQALTYRQFKEIIENFIVQQSTANLRVRSTFFRHSGGRYTPKQHTFDYHLEATPLANSVYPISSAPITIGIAKQVRLTTDILSNLKTTSALPYVMAGLEKKQQGWNECLLLNEQGYIVEATAANVFLKIGKCVLTPALEQGCIAGVLRQHLLQLLPQLGYQVEEGKVAIEQLFDAQEVWLSNVLQGVVGVHFCAGREQPYSRDIAEKVQHLLNKGIKKNKIE